jgi:hypothetical protein
MQRPSEVQHDDECDNRRACSGRKLSSRVINARRITVQIEIRLDEEFSCMYVFVVNHEIIRGI